MQVILLKNVNKLGKAGEIKNVSDGYAMNFLIPRKLAEAATEERIKKSRNQEINKTKERENTKDVYMQKLKKLEEIGEIILARKASNSGKLFAGIGTKEIVEEFKKQKRIEVEEKFVKLDKYIKIMGSHEIEINFGGGLKTIIRLRVVSI